MNFSTEALKQIPPIVALSGDNLMVSGSHRDVHSWLQTENIRRSNAFIIHDNCGCLLKRYKSVLMRNGYEVNVLDTTCGAESARYNPFSYIRDNRGVTELTDAIIRGTKGSGDYDDYGFLLTEWLLLKILFGYIHENAIEDELNFNTALEIMKRMEIPEDWEDYKTAVDYLFESLENREPFNSTVLRYEYYKKTPYAKDNRLLDSCAARLAPFVTKQALDLMSKDELRFDDLYYLKIALFVRTDKNCSMSNFLTPLMYSQFYNIAYKHAIQ